MVGLDFIYNTALCTSALYMGYPITSYMLHYTSKFRHSTRKPYIVKNVQKSACLLFLFIYSLFYIMSSPDWDNDVIRFVATAYVSNDIVGLFKCKLPISTTLHHLSACCFLLFSYFVDFETSVEAQLIFYYTFFSAATCYVNLYLGLRFCYSTRLPNLLKLCQYGYTITLLCNWSLQLYIGYNAVHAWYMVIIGFIVYDDIVLLRWLWCR